MIIVDKFLLNWIGQQKNVTKRPDLNTITMSLVTGLWELRRPPKKFFVVVSYLLLSSTQIISVLYFFQIAF